MPQPPTLKINEIFSSFQGEGLRQGEPTIFVRLSGCNLRCSFCDTRLAWDEGLKKTPEEVKLKVERIHRDFPANWICLTGGEPLLQEVSLLLLGLKASGFKVQLETNATQPPQFPVDWYTISPKPPDYSFQPEYLGLAKEVKLVITSEFELSNLLKLRGQFPHAIPFLLQPESNKKEAMQKTAQLAQEALKAGLQNVRISIQLHRLYGWR